MKTMWTMAAIAILAAGCGGGGDGGGDPGPSPSVATIAVAPADLTLDRGDATQLGATLRDASGNVLQGKSIAWSSGDPSRVAVTPNGVVRALGTGTTMVTAVAEGKSAAARVVVVEPQGRVDRVVLNTVSERIEEGATLQLTATSYDAADGVLTGRAVRWSSSDTGTVAVSDTGLVTALRPGIVSVMAAVEGREAAATIRVFADYAFDLLYSAADAATPEKLYSLDINDPAASALPVFPLGGPASHGTPSPDGQRIAFVVHREWNGTYWQSMIFVANRDGSNAQRLTYSAARNTEPAWAPDGSRIAFTSQVFGEAAEVWVMDADGSNLVNLTADQPTGSKRSPAWSPPLGNAGLRIAYALETEGASFLWTMRADGSDKRSVTSDPSFFDAEPAWSPDGGTLVFQRSGAAVFGDLYLVSSTGGGARALMPGNPLAHGQFGPAWSPDGRLIAFASKHALDDRYQIWTVWSDGTRLAQRTEDLKNHADPAWITRGQ